MKQNAHGYGQKYDDTCHLPKSIWGEALKTVAYILKIFEQIYS